MQYSASAITAMMAEAEAQMSASMMSDSSVSDSSSISDEEECKVENFDATSLTMVQVISECKDDAIIMSSTKGPAILELLDCLLEGCIESKELEKLKEIMILCVLSRKNKISEIWRNFHVIRLSCYHIDMAILFDFTL